MNIKMQKPADKVWADEAGNKIPFARLTATEKLMEKSAFQIATRAYKLNKELRAFKAYIRLLCEGAYNSFMIENDGKELSKKGNYTWFNFDRSIRIEVDIQEAIKFDDLTIALAKEKLDDFIGSNIKGAEDFIKDLIMSAFATQNGRLDVKKVLGLKRHKSRIKDQRYHDAMDLIDKAIRRPDSKSYYRVSVRLDDGQYEGIDLNFSSVAPYEEEVECS
jgi:hypothetical protein